MTQAQRKKQRVVDTSQTVRQTAQERQADREYRMMVREIQEVSAEQCGLHLVGVALGPQFYVRNFHERVHLDLKTPKDETHDRQTVDGRFDPRAYERNSRMTYYQLPIPTPAPA